VTSVETHSAAPLNQDSRFCAILTRRHAGGRDAHQGNSVRDEHPVAGGFVLMGIGLTLNRQQKIGVSIAFGLMGAGTVLVFVGLYVAVPATP
jgi:hypothetical protein